MLETNGYQQFVTFDIDGFEQVTKQLDRQTNLPVYRGFMGKNNGPWYLPALFTIRSALDPPRNIGHQDGIPGPTSMAQPASDSR